MQISLETHILAELPIKAGNIRKWQSSKKTRDYGKMSELRFHGARKYEKSQAASLQKAALWFL